MTTATNGSRGTAINDTIDTMDKAAELIGAPATGIIAGGLGSYFLLRQECGVAGLEPNETFEGDLCIFEGSPGCVCTNVLSQVLNHPYHPDVTWFSSLIGFALGVVGLVLAVLHQANASPTS